MTGINWGTPELPTHKTTQEFINELYGKGILKVEKDIMYIVECFKCSRSFRSRLPENAATWGKEHSCLCTAKILQYNCQEPLNHETVHHIYQGTTENNKFFTLTW